MFWCRLHHHQHQVTNQLKNCIQTLFWQNFSECYRSRKLHLFLSSYGFMNIHRRWHSLANGRNEDG